MGDLHQICQFARYDFQKTKSNPRTYVVMAGVLLILLWHFRELPSYLVEQGASVHMGEVYILGMNSLTLTRYIYMGLVLLICDVSFMESGTSYYLLRSKKSCWFLGQILYLFGLIVGYNIFLFVVFFLCTGGHVSLAHSWSEVIQTAVRMRELPPPLAYCFIEPLVEWQDVLSPMTSVLISFVWGCLWMFTLAVLFFVLVLAKGIRVGSFFLGGTFLLDLFYRQWAGGTWWHKFSPITLGRWMDLGVAMTLPVWSYGVAYYLTLLLGAIIIGKHLLRNVDVMKG